MAKKKTSTYKKVEKAVKNTSPKIIAVTLIFLVLGLILGVGSCYFLTKNDKFEIIGEKDITLNVGDSYVERGAKVIAFGKDLSNQIEIESDVNTSVAGIYVVKYKVNNFKYKDIVRVRYVTVLEVE